MHHKNPSLGAVFAASVDENPSKRESRQCILLSTVIITSALRWHRHHYTGIVHPLFAQCETEASLMPRLIVGIDFVKSVQLVMRCMFFFSCYMPVICCCLLHCWPCIQKAHYRCQPMSKQLVTTTVTFVVRIHIGIVHPLFAICCKIGASLMPRFCWICVKCFAWSLLLLR